MIKISGPKKEPDRSLRDGSVLIQGCVFDTRAIDELIDTEANSVQIRDCFIIKRDRFWRFVFLTVTKTVLHYLSFGATPHPTRTH